ncbi:MAG: GNAT family N-acetyltransferase [Candidatus Nanoarchaeia archaeon]
MDGCIIVAILNNNIVGYLCGGINKPEPYRTVKKSAELENMFVLEEYRSKGVGKKLFNEFKKWCKQHKVNIIKVTAFTANGRAIKFYRNSGFRDYTLTLETHLD